MSASSQLATTTSPVKGIPTRRVIINHESEMPTDYGTTPGGTMFGTTPGGTKIVYERAFLMHMRQSPLSRTPPTNLPHIPGVTAPRENNKNHHDNKQHPPRRRSSDEKSHSPNKGRTHESIKEEEDQFAMDM